MGRISMPQGKGSQMHNRREYEKYGKHIPNNIDAFKSSENITLVDKDIRQAYQEIFGGALEQYNGKQKRADRKIEDYYEHIQKSKNGEKPFYEDVIQWGGQDDFKSPEVIEKAKEALIKYAEGFEERSPNLKLIGAYIHMDEASPHMHLDYIPVATGYTRGLEKRNSLDKAMKQMGFRPDKENRKNNATKLWKESEREVFGEICRNLGLEVEAERKARGSLSVAEYKDAKDKMMGGLEQEKKALVAEVESLRELKIGIDEIDGAGKTRWPGGMVMINSKDFEVIKNQAKAYIANRDEIEMQREQKQQLEDEKQQLENREVEVELEHNRQSNLNQLLEKSERAGRAKDKKIADLQAENGTLRGQIRSLTARIDQIKADLWDKINNLTDKLRGAYESFSDIVKAVGMLKYDERSGYKIEGLTKKQGRFIDGLAKYGAKRAREDGFPELAEDMENHIGLSRDLKKIVEPAKDRDQER